MGKRTCRFPVSRIKKIMQEDEDVGRIANGTSVLMSKCLELFVQQLCLKSLVYTRKSNSSSLQPAHVKECVKECGVFDFLIPTTEGVSNEANKSKKRKDEQSSTPKRQRRSKKQKKTLHMDSLLDDELPEEEEFTFNNQLSQKKEDTKELVLKTESSSTSEVTHNTVTNSSTSETPTTVFMKKEVTNIQLDENYDD